MGSNGNPFWFSKKIFMLARRNLSVSRSLLQGMTRTLSLNRWIKPCVKWRLPMKSFQRKHLAEYFVEQFEMGERSW
jgi:hypothetical protein